MAAMTPVSPGMLRRLAWLFSDTWVLARRNLLRYQRLPQLLVFSTLQPVMFVLLFNYVFGGAIQTGEENYINFLLPGIFVQVVVFGATQTGVGLAEDMSQGMVDRFRSLPMARAAVLTGRTLADTIRNLFVVALMIGVGFLIGFRFEADSLTPLAVPLVAVLLGLAFSWIMAYVGLLTRNVETAQVAGFVLIFPLVFASSMFVPVPTMPDWLQLFADNSPITVTVDSLRALSHGGPVWDPLWKALLWMAGIMAVFAPLAVSRYRKAV